MRDARYITIAVVLAAILVLFGFVGGWNWRKAVDERKKEEPKPDTIVEHHWDTLYLPSVPDTVKDTEIKFVPVPFYVDRTDTIVDSILVPLTFERHFASLDSVADVWYSGYDAKIDSAVVYKRYTTQIIRQPYEVEVWKMPRFTADLGVTAFYSEKSISPFFFGEMRYNAHKTTFATYGAIDHNGRWAAGVGVSYRFNLIK